MKNVFDTLRGMSGGKLTKKQVDATNKLLSFNPKAVHEMLNISQEQKSMKTKDLNIIKEFEGLRLEAYDDGVGVMTIGYGTTRYPDGTRVKRGDKITLEQAEEYLRHDLRQFEVDVNNLVKVPLTQNQFDALTSIVYNIGSGAFSKSTLLKKLNERDYKGAADQFLVWNKAGGRTLQGLVNRRTRERQLFLKQ